MNVLQWNRLTSGTHSCESIGATSGTKHLAECVAVGRVWLKRGEHEDNNDCIVQLVWLNLLFVRFGLLSHV